MSRNGHLLITGTGRAGTSFLVRYLTELGLDTHLSRQGNRAVWDDAAQAGLEDLPILSDPKSVPYVVKTPWIAEYVAQILAHPDFTIEAVIIPVRDLVTTASSRAIVELQHIHRQQPALIRLDEMWETWGWTTGGVVASLHPLDQARILAVWFHRLVERLVDADVPIIFVAFPRLIEDANYVYDKLRPFLPPGTTADQARAAHRQVVDLDKVRVERELRDEATRVTPRADATELEFPSSLDLDRLALRREVDRLRREVEQRSAEVAALQATLTRRSAEVAALQATLTRRSAEAEHWSSALAAVYQSRSWRLTKPLRALRTLWRRV